jgi:hypothetical protein
MVRLVALVGVGSSVLATIAVAAPPAGASVEQNAQRQVVQTLDRMPLLFVPEQVSADGTEGYVVRGSEASIWLSASGLRYRLNPHAGSDPATGAGSWVVALDLVGATPRAPVGEDPLPTKVSYFKGPKAEWRTGLPSFSSVRYREPWRGVDVVVSGTAGELESTFIVRPGVDPSLIRLAYRGATAVRLEPDGSLVVDTPLGSITERPPIAYQLVDGRRTQVAAAFELEDGSDSGRKAYSFRLGEYDPARELIVDPVTLVYCGYIGGSADDRGYGIAVDGEGNAYVTGDTFSAEGTFPVKVGPDLTYEGDRDAFVAKVNAAGTALDYCGYIGGSEVDTGRAIAVDVAGNAYIAGVTNSTELTFPVTVGPGLTHNGGDDTFVARVNADGTALDYCGYIGGSTWEFGAGVAVDDAGSAFVTGGTNSTQASFPVTLGPDLTFNGSVDAFVAKVNEAGTALDYCGYIGGSEADIGRAIGIDVVGAAYVTGGTDSPQATFPVAVGPGLTFGGYHDAFVAKVNAAGTALDYCGYIGGWSDDSAWGLALDSAGNAYVAGSTHSTEASFPVTVGPDLSHNGDFDAYVAKVNADGTALDYCGYIGGSGGDYGSGIAVDAAGNAYVSGETGSTEATFPATVGPDLSYNGDLVDAFVAKVSGFLFDDGFESGDTSAWSATVP